MSLTVEDLLQLPSLRSAEVVAGRNGLQRIVCSISVLESSDPGLLNDSMFHNDEFFGSEIVISGFLNLTENVPLQCGNLRRLAEGGEAGLILFYVGAFLKEIAPPLRELADELGFPIICMPRGRVDLRYSDVIYDVMDAIIKEQSKNSSIVVELLDHISSLPQHQQNMSTAAKLLSDRTRATVILTDSARNVLNEAAWPRTLDGLHKNLRQIRLPEPLEEPVSLPDMPDSFLYHSVFKAAGSLGRELFIVRQMQPLGAGDFQKCVEFIRLASRLWDQHSDRDVISELVNSILQDEPLKMRRLADLFHIDIASITAMWIIASGGGESIPPELVDELRELARPYCLTSFADVYEGQLVLFMDSSPTLAEAASLRAGILAGCPQDTVITQFSNLQNTSDVRLAFLTNRECLEYARRVFPGRSYYSGGEMEFVSRCRGIVLSGEDEVAKASEPLELLKSARDGSELVRTLSVYLLDTDMGLQETSERLFLHRNTIKYRLKCISETLGFRVGSMPASSGLYTAAGVGRILSVGPRKA